MAGKVTVGLVSHWPCITDFSGLSTYKFNGLQDDEHPAYTPLRSMAPLYLLAHHNWFSLFHFHFCTSGNYWTIFKYNKMFRVCSRSLPEFNQLLLSIFCLFPIFSKSAHLFNAVLKIEISAVLFTGWAWCTFVGLNFPPYCIVTVCLLVYSVLEPYSGVPVRV